MPQTTQEPWSIEKEFLDLTGQCSIERALFDCGLLSSPLEFVGIHSSSAWRRGGAETYIFDFEVICVASRRRLIAKALVAASPGIPPEKQLDLWYMRRDLIQRSGCPVPTLYVFGKGILIEEYVQDSLVDVLRDGHNTKLFMKLHRYASNVISAGFCPTSFIPNLRTDGKRLFWIDFGNDLGEPQKPNRDPQSLQRLYDEYERYTGVKVSGPERIN